MVKTIILEIYKLLTIIQEVATESLLKETPTQVFSNEYCEIFKSAYFEKQLETAASKMPLDSFRFHKRMPSGHYISLTHFWSMFPLYTPFLPIQRSNRNTRIRCEICSKLPINTLG